jgi:hypothetical protein
MSKIIEQSQPEGIRQLFERVDRMEMMLKSLEHAEICFGGTSPNSYPIGTKVLTITDIGGGIPEKSWNKIKHFYQLEELTLQNCQQRRFDEKQIPTLVSSSSVKKLTLVVCPSFSDPIFIKNFPNLRELYINSMPALNTQFVLILRSINHKLTKLTFENCHGLNKTEIQEYCTQNGIQLKIV